MSSTATPMQSFKKIVFCAFLELFLSEDFKVNLNVLGLDVRHFMQWALTKPCLAATSLKLLLEEKCHIVRLFAQCQQ